MAKYVTTRPAKYLLRVLLRAKYLQVLLSVSIPSYLWLEYKYQCEIVGWRLLKGEGAIRLLPNYCQY